MSKTFAVMSGIWQTGKLDGCLIRGRVFRSQSIMAIYRLIANGSFGPLEIEAMTAAYEAALLDLGLVNRDDPLTEMVANAIVNITSRGERDPMKIKNRALRAMGTPKWISAGLGSNDQARPANLASGR
jgi:hypothetical protein